MMKLSKDILFMFAKELDIRQWFEFCLINKHTFSYLFKCGNWKKWIEQDFPHYVKQSEYNKKRYMTLYRRKQPAGPMKKLICLKLSSICIINTGLVNWGIECVSSMRLLEAYQKAFKQINPTNKKSIFVDAKYMMYDFCEVDKNKIDNIIMILEEFAIHPNKDAWYEMGFSGY